MPLFFQPSDETLDAVRQAIAAQLPDAAPEHRDRLLVAMINTPRAAWSDDQVFSGIEFVKPEAADAYVAACLSQYADWRDGEFIVPAPAVETVIGA